MRVTVHVRELDLQLDVGDGTQNVRWLATLAALRYARHRGLQHEMTQAYVPTSATDENERNLMPLEALKDALEAPFEVTVELAGPFRSWAEQEARVQRDQLSLWERLAFSPEESWVNKRFHVDLAALPEALREQPCMLVGNWTAWERGVPMRADPARPGMLVAEQRLPPGAPLVFHFCIGEHSFVTSRYEVTRDEQGNRHNYLMLGRDAASAAAAAAAEAANSIAGDEVRGGGSGDGSSCVVVPATQPARVERGAEGDLLGVRMLPRAVTGMVQFRTTASLSGDALRAAFERDCESVQISDVVLDSDVRKLVREALWTHYEKLRHMFKFYSCRSAGDIATMNAMEFLAFCRACNVVDRVLTVPTLDLLFHRVNVDDGAAEAAMAAAEAGAPLPAQSPASSGGLPPDAPSAFSTSNPDRAMRMKGAGVPEDAQLNRGEFMEVLVRIARIKHSQVPADQALERMLAVLEMPRVLQASEESLRSELLDEAVQRVYKKYQRQLYRLFRASAAADSNDRDANTMSITEFEILLQKFSLYDKDLSRRTALAAFAMSQEDSLDDADSYRMVYAEFLEVLGRIARLKFPAGSMARRLQNLMHVFFG
jgi:hypothetical protein